MIKQMCYQKLNKNMSFKKSTIYTKAEKAFLLTVSKI